MTWPLGSTALACSSQVYHVTLTPASSAPEAFCPAKSSMRRLIVPTSGARSKPISRPNATGSNRVRPSALGSPSSPENTRAKMSERIV